MRTMMLTASILGAVLLVGCGSPVTIHAPDDFVVLEDDDYGPYDARATTAHGVVVAGRAVDNEEEGSLEFWLDAIRNRLRTMGGYALLEETEVTAGSGHQGTQLRFGRDEGGHTYLYWLSVFVTEDTVYLVEAGGRQELFEEAQESVARTIADVVLD